MAKYDDNSEFPTEALITTRVTAYLKTLPYWTGWKASDRFHPGVSDFIGCYYGTFVGIELKSATGQPTALQLQFIVNTIAMGGFGTVCSTMGQVKGFLAHVKKMTMFRLCVETEEELVRVLNTTLSLPKA